MDTLIRDCPDCKGSGKQELRYDMLLQTTQRMLRKLSNGTVPLWLTTPQRSDMARLCKQGLARKRDDLPAGMEAWVITDAGTLMLERHAERQGIRAA